MKHLKALVLVFFMFSFEHADAQATITKKETLDYNATWISSKDKQGTPGILLEYKGNLPQVTSAQLFVGSCEQEFSARIKNNNKTGERAVFIIDPKGRLTVGEGGRLFLDKTYPVLGVSVINENVDLGFQ